MNAWMISYSFYEIDYRVRRYAEALASQGANVDMFALQKDGAPRQETIRGVRLNRLQRRQYNERGPLSFLVRILLFFARVFLVVSWRSLRQKPQLIHVHNVPDFLVFTCIVPKLMGVPVILDIHDILPEFYCQKFGISPKHPLARFLHFVEWISVRFADHVIVANELWRRKLIDRTKISPERCTTILNYPDEVFFRDDLQADHPQHPFRIIYPGTISHLHGIDIAVRALAKVRQSVPDARLDIYSSRIGGFPYFDEVSRLVSELGLQEHVAFCQAIPHEQMSQLLQSASVGVVPKRQGIFASEAFSTKIFEFMAAGVPVVASRTQIDQFYFDDSLIAFFEPENPDDLARRLLELHADAGKRQSLSEASRLFMSDKRWDQKKEIYYRIVEKLLGYSVVVNEAQREEAGVRQA